MGAMGLKLGIHTLRGSVSKATVDELATTQCSWNNNWYAVNASHPAAQTWLNSVYKQYADWGVDLIKNDCIFAHYMEESNIRLISNAISSAGRPTIYSLSPGTSHHEQPLGEFDQAQAIAPVVNMYRVTSDWHGGSLDYHFEVAHTMEPLIGVKGFGGQLSFPDLDMLNPYTNAKDDEDFRLQMTLWAIARSPLIYGADIRSASLTAEDFSLLTNEEVLEVSAASSHNRQIFRNGGVTVWAASGPQSSIYVALMNTGASPAPASVALRDLGAPAASYDVRDLWKKSVMGTVTMNVTTQLPKSNGATLLKLTPSNTMV